MNFIESESYCEKCKKTVIARRSLPEMTWYYKTLTVLTLGFWPLYRIRVGWKCTECGSSADAQKVHIVARSMGGLRSIDEIRTTGFCPSCQRETGLRRRLPQPTPLHQQLSLFTGGAWAYYWLQFGWKCAECNSDADGVLPSSSTITMASEGFCNQCGKDVKIRRRMPQIKLPYKILSLMTVGGMPFHWFSFGWECTECGGGPDVKVPLIPKKNIEYRQHCVKCQQETLFQKKPPSLNIFDRILSLFSGGFWAIYRIRSGWRCTQCGGKAKAEGLIGNINEK